MRYSSYAVAKLTVTLLGVVTVLHAHVADAQQTTETSNRFVSTFDMIDRDADLLRPVVTLGDPDQWLIPNDLPGAAFQLRTEQIHLRLTVDSTDKITHCSIEHQSASPPTNERACALIGRVGRFRHALSRAGHPTTGLIDMFLNFGSQRMLAPPAPPPPPPGGFPYEAGLRVVRLPDWHSFATPDIPDGEAVISLSIFPATHGRPEARYCQPLLDDRDGPLAKASCAAAKAGEYAPVPNAAIMPSIKMLVRWQHGEASYRLPSQVRGTPLEILNESSIPGVAFPAGSIAKDAEAAVTFGPDGRLRCMITASAGSDEADRRVCASLNQLRFNPETDIFGRKIATTRVFRYDR